MAAKVSQTLKVLMEMRDEMRGIRVVLSEHGERLGGVQRGLVDLREVVVAELVANRKAFEHMAQVLGDRRDRHRTRLDDHERRLRRLERKAG